MGKIYDEALKRAKKERVQSIGPHEPSQEVEPRSVERLVETVRSSTTEEGFIPTMEGLVESQVPIAHQPIGAAVLDEELVVLTDPESVMSEQFKKTVAVLSQLRLAKGHKTFMVTSSLPREGKTITVCNLGVAIAQALDDQAILIDCDLRRPGVHQRFGLNGRPGLAELLMYESEIPEVIHEVAGLRLKIIPAGSGIETPAQLLFSQRMANSLCEIKARYQDHYIILDTTPILLTAETAVLARLVDGVILVIMAGKTSRDLVKRATKEIPHEKIIGIVLNHVESNARYYRGYHYHLSRSSGIRRRLKLPLKPF